MLDSLPFNYGSFDMDAMWFLGTGMAIILAGFLNLVVIREAGQRDVDSNALSYYQHRFCFAVRRRALSISPTASIPRFSALWYGRRRWRFRGTKRAS
jgi:hypothetical protein